MNSSALTSHAPPAELAAPQIRLHGEVGEPMLQLFIDALSTAEQTSGPVVVELTTTGGDADVGLRIATDLRLFAERTGRQVLIFGKAVVYSAGVTILSAAPRTQRWLARPTTLLVHGRSITRKLELSGPLALERKRLEGVLAELDAGLAQERSGFEALIAGSDVTLDELLERASVNWYLDADEALRRGLVAGVV